MTSSYSQFYNKTQEKIEQKLTEYLSDHLNDSRDILQKAIRHSLLSGGKRFRPLLTMATHQLFSSKLDDILPLACVFEIIHTYSLIHDDLPSMDNDDFRRGKPTCHKLFGEDIAILAGDALNTLAFEIASNELSHYDSSNILKVIHLISSKMGVHGLVGGQILDIKSSSDGFSLDHLKKLHQKKTGALIELCIITPAILENVSKSDYDKLLQFSQHLGLLFQIVDDILDVTGDINTLGKTPNKDISLNKLTYITLLGLEKSQELANQEANLALKTLTFLSNTQTSLLEDIVHYVHKRVS